MRPGNELKPAFSVFQQSREYFLFSFWSLQCETCIRNCLSNLEYKVSLPHVSTDPIQPDSKGKQPLPTQKNNQNIHNQIGRCVTNVICTESFSQIHNCINDFISRRITIWLDRDLLRIVTILANFHEYSRIQNVKFYLHKWKITYLHT